MPSTPYVSPLLPQGNYTITLTNTTIIVNGVTYVFQNWNNDPSQNSPSILVNLQANTTLTAVFKAEFQLTIDSAPEINVGFSISGPT